MPLIPRGDVLKKEKQKAMELARLAERDLWRSLIADMVSDAPFWVKPWVSRYVREKGLI